MNPVEHPHGGGNHQHIGELTEIFSSTAYEGLLKTELIELIIIALKSSIETCVRCKKKNCSALKNYNKYLETSKPVSRLHVILIHNHFPGKASTVKRGTSAGRKVGLIAARRTGRIRGGKTDTKKEA